MSGGVVYRGNDGRNVYKCMECGAIPARFYLEVDGHFTIVLPNGQLRKEFAKKCGSVYVCSKACAAVVRRKCGKPSYDLVPI
jgi:hypothetical protein